MASPIRVEADASRALPESTEGTGRLEDGKTRGWRAPTNEQVVAVAT